MKRLRYTLVAAASSICFQCASAGGIDKNAYDILKYGAPRAKLLWNGVKAQIDPEKPIEAGRFSALANRIRQRQQEGALGSELIKSSGDFISALIAKTALETKDGRVALGLLAASYGAKKSFDYLASQVVQMSEDEIVSVLSQGLSEAQLTSAEIQSMSPQQLRARVSDLTVGGQKLSELVSSNPKALRMIEAASEDAAKKIGVEGIIQSRKIGRDVVEARSAIDKVNRNLVEFQNENGARLEKIEESLSDVKAVSEELRSSVDKLSANVAANSQVLGVLASISYEGWTTEQKLRAVENGMFPNLAPDEKRSITENLSSTLRMERVLGKLQSTSEKIGSITQIAANLGLPPNVVTGLQASQVVVNSVTKLFSGDALGAVAGITSLLGLGGPDPAAQRHEQLMSFLDEQFSDLRGRLVRIEELQRQTLESVAALALAQQAFQQKVMSKLDQIEDEVLENRQLLLNLVLARWSDCHSLIYGTALNGQFEIPSLADLIAIISDGTTRVSAAGCYNTMSQFLDGKVAPANWAADIIDESKFPTENIPGSPDEIKVLKTLQEGKVRAFEAAREFLVAYVSKADFPITSLVARITQPSYDASRMDALNAAYAKDAASDVVAKTRCHADGALSRALLRLLCVGVAPGAQTIPAKDRLLVVLRAPLIGRHAYWLIDAGMVLADISDFALLNNLGQFEFVIPKSIQNASQDGISSEMADALGEHNGDKLIEKLLMLAEAIVLQQSVAYGDTTARLIEEALYDPVRRELSVSQEALNADPYKSLAFAAMKVNPVLARNVVMLAMRHAISDTVGGNAEQVNYRQTLYKLALEYAKSQIDCGVDGQKGLDPWNRLYDLFASWHFSYREGAAEKATRHNDGVSATACADAIEGRVDGDSPIPNLGTGVSVNLNDIYVTLPPPALLSQGIFEVAPSLDLALAYREKILNAMLDRDTLRLAEDVVVRQGNGNQDEVERFSAELLVRVLQSE